MADFYNLMYMIIHLFDIVIMYKIFGVFFESKPTSKLFFVISYGLYYFATGLIYIVFGIPILTLFINIITLWIISLNCKAKLKKRLLFVVSSYFIFWVSELLICGITGYYNRDIFVTGSYNSIFGQALIKVFTYFVCVIISYLKNIKRDVPIRKSSWFVTFFVPVSSMYMEFNFIQSENINQFQACLSIVIIMVLNYICLYMYDSLSSMYQIKMNETLLEQEKNYYFHQCELMKESTEQLKAFRHDMKNHFFMLKEMCDNKMYNDLSIQLEKHAQRITEHKYYSQSGNMVVDSIINFKLKNADIDGIEVNSEILIPSKINIEISDLVTVLGNLLDNSITALSAVEKNKKLYLKIMYDRGRVIICIKNTYSNPVKYTNGEIITTKSDEDSHGYGLINIKKAIEKYDGYMEIDHSNNVFSVDIIMFVLP